MPHYYKATINETGTPTQLLTFQEKEGGGETVYGKQGNQTDEHAKKKQPF